MTIRSNVNIAAINNDYSAFLTACERAPFGTFELSKSILFMLGTQCDALIGAARALEIGVSTSDGIREIEALMFDMLRRENPLSEIESAIGLGRSLQDYPESAERILAGLERDRAFLAGLSACDIDMDDGLERMAQMVIDPMVEDEPDLDDGADRFGGYDEVY